MKCFYQNAFSSGQEDILVDWVAQVTTTFEGMFPVPYGVPDVSISRKRESIPIPWYFGSL